MKKYINEENEVQFYYVHIYLGFLNAFFSGSMVVRGVFEGKGTGYLCFFAAGAVISLLIGITSTIKYKRKKK